MVLDLLSKAISNLDTKWGPPASNTTSGDAHVSKDRAYVSEDIECLLLISKKENQDSPIQRNDTTVFEEQTSLQKKRSCDHDK